jgi:hypothetical protein
MNQLLYVLMGWVGMLARPAVLLQAGVILALLLAYGGWKGRSRPGAGSWRPVLAKLVLLVALALGALLIGLLGMPSGLVQFLAALLLVWTGLDAIRLLLRRVQPPALVDGYWFRAVRPLFLLLALVGLIERFDGLEEIADLPLLELFGQPLTGGSLVLLLALPYFLVVLSELPVLVCGLVLERLLGLSAANRKVFELVLRYALISIGVLWLANQVGLNGTAIAAIAGGLSVGLGFGIKEVFSNFVSGLWLLFEGSVRPGDVLVVDGDVCQVRKLGLRATTLWRDADNAELVVPNQTFFTTTATTYTGTDERRRGQVLVGAHYRHDPEQVIVLLEQVAKAHPRVLADPPPKAFLMNYGDSSIDYSLRFWMADPMTNLSISSEVRRAIWRVFEENGIEIPFPQRVVHTVSDA